MQFCLLITTACNYLIKAKARVKKEKKKIIEFLCQHNLSKIKTRLDWKLGESEKDQKLAKELDSL